MITDDKHSLLKLARSYLPKDAVDEYFETVWNMEKIDNATWDEEMDTLALCVMVEGGVQLLKEDGMDKKAMKRFFRELMETHYA